MTPPDWVQAMVARCADATPPPWTYGRHQSMSKDEMIAYLINCVEVSPLTDQFYIVGAPDWGADVCHTGNGTTSERNAAFIAHARSDVPGLLALVVELAEDVRSIRRSLDQSMSYQLAARTAARLDATLARYHAGPGATTGGGT